MAQVLLVYLSTLHRLIWCWELIYKQTASIKGARVLAFGPPMVPGFAMSNGLTISMEDRTGGEFK